MSKIYQNWVRLQALQNGEALSEINGAAGPRGEKGEKGEKGDTGATGQTGEKGEKGEQGAAAPFVFTVHASFDASKGNNFSWASDEIASSGVSNIVRDSEGVFTITFSTAFVAANSYTVVASAGSGNHTSSGRSVSIDARTAESCTIRVERTDTGTQQDEAYIALIALGA